MGVWKTDVLKNDREYQNKITFLLGDTLKVWLFAYDGEGTRVKQVYTEGASTLTNYYAKHPESEASKG